MTPEDVERNIEALCAWTDEAADILNRLHDRIQAIEVRLGDLNSRIDEWDIRT